MPYSVNIPGRPTLLFSFEGGEGKLGEGLGGVEGGETAVGIYERRIKEKYVF